MEVYRRCVLTRLSALRSLPFLAVSVLSEQDVLRHIRERSQAQPAQAPGLFPGIAPDHYTK